MASTKTAPQQNVPTRQVSRTYRAAIRLGEDFVTLEETIVLPLDATDEEVGQAVELGWRIYRAQTAAVAAQVGDIRAGAVSIPSMRVQDPDAPASGKQKNYIQSLAEDLGWTAEKLDAYAASQGLDLAELTKGRASAFIDGLKALLAQGPPAPREGASRQSGGHEDRRPPRDQESPAAATAAAPRQSAIGRAPAVTTPGPDAGTDQGGPF